MGRKKKNKICDKVKPEEEEDRISQLPEALITQILYHLTTKDAVRTSLMSTKWRNLWQSVPGMDLDLDEVSLSNLDDFSKFGDRFFDSHKVSWIQKLQLKNIDVHYGEFDLDSWIDVVTKSRVQHLDVDCYGYDKIPLSIYTCQTLKLISGSPVLEDLKIISYSNEGEALVLQLRSHTLKRIEIDIEESSIQVVVDAPLLQCLRTKVYKAKSFQIINSGFPAKLDIDLRSEHFYPTEEVIHDILTDISRVRDLVISSNNTWKDILLYSNSGKVLQFRDLSRLNAGFSKSDLEMLPKILESCPRLESFTLELVKDPSMCGKMKKEPNVMFSAVPPRCLVSSLKFVELKRSIPRYEGEMELIRYFLKNSSILEKLRLNVYYTKKEKCDFLTELVSMTRCSSACKVLVL